MKKQLLSVCVLVAVAVGMSSAVIAAPAAKTYQATGPVLELTESKIVIQKGDEKWEVARDADTKVTGELKVGAKVTIEYRMFATSATVKDSKDAAAPAPAKEAAAEKK